MSKRGTKLYLQDILDSIGKIEGYLKDRAYEKFVNDEMVLDAVIRNMEIIGEAAKNIPADTKRANPWVPWKKIAGMRNKITHEYFGIDIEILWQTIQEDLPGLKKQIKKVLEEAEN